MNKVVAILCLVGGYALLWGIVLKLDKATAFAGNALASITGKAQKALSDYRGNTMKRRTSEVLSGQRDWGGIGKTMRYASLMGKPGMGGNVFTKKGREAMGKKLSYAENALMGRTGAELLKNEDGSVAGNDRAMGVITKGVLNGEDYENKYVAQARLEHERNNPGIAWNAEHEADARKEALDTRTEIESRMGSDIGNRATRRAAAHARWTSVSAYNDWNLDTKEGRRGMRAEMAEEIGAMMNEGGMTMTEVAATLKKNTQRTDISGHSFPQIMFQADAIAKRYKARKGGTKNIKGRKMDENGGVVNDKVTGKPMEEDLYAINVKTGKKAAAGGDGAVLTLMSEGEMEAWDRRSIEYVNAGQDMGQRTEAVKVHAAVARERIQQEYQKTNQQIEVARARSREIQATLDDQKNDSGQVVALGLKSQLEAAQAEEARALSGAMPAGMGGLEYEEKQRAAQEKVRTLRQRVAEVLQRQAEYKTDVDRMQVELVRNVATVMGKQTVMGSYSSPENQRVFYEGVLSQPVDPNNPEGPTIMELGEELRDSSETYRNFERSYVQRASAGAAAALAASTAAGAAAGPGAGMPTPGPKF